MSFQKNQKLTDISNLPSFPLNIILSFLVPKNIYCSLCLTCKSLYKYISSSEYIKNESQRRCLGLSESFKFPINFDGIGLLKNLSDETFWKDIPFYGYFTDGGMDNNNTEYWVNRVFTRGDWSICSRSGKNFHIIGSLIKGKEMMLSESLIYKEILKFSEEIFSQKFWYDSAFECFRTKPTEMDLYLKDKYFRYMMSDNKEKVWQFLENNKKKLNNNEILKSYNTQEIMNALENYNFHTKIPKEKIQFINNFVLMEKNIVFETNKMAIIAGFDFSRTGYFTCPVKTLMIFVSEDKIDYDLDTQYRIFDDCVSSHHLEQKLKELSLNHCIKSTNIENLYEFSEIRKNSIEQFELVIFSNSIKHQLFGKYKPMIWMKIKDEFLNCISANFPNANFFAGKNVMIKMINFEKKMEEDDPNIDINFIILKGEVLTL